MIAAEDAGALVMLGEKRSQFDPLSLETRAALQQATAVVIDDVRKRFGDELVNDVLAAAGNGNAL
jgi:TRAP-type transport system periplasmic protein